jgi:hypothetical protein
MSQERMDGLATLCIEKKLLDDIDIDSIPMYLYQRMFEETL